MTRRSFPFPVASLTFVLAFLFQTASRAQSAPTALRAFEPSAFAGLTGTYTGLDGGRNAGLTAGFDLGFHPFFGLLPSLEIRGTYPISSGSIAGEESFEGGLRVQKRFRRVRPYVDVLFGRGQLNYQNGGFVVPIQNYEYVQSTSNVFSPGLGFETDINEHFALLLDGQLQHWSVPFTPDNSSTNSSAIYSKVGSVGVVYRFGWLLHGHPAP